jgi:replicative DNA helicase
MEQSMLSEYIPYSQEAEEAVLGSILIKPSIFIEMAAILDKADFFILRHQYIFDAMARLHERRAGIDYMVVGTELKAMDKLDEIGGPAYLTQLINNTPTSIHAETYSRIVESAAIRRQMLNAAERIKLLALDEEITAGEVIVESEKELLGVGSKTRDPLDMSFKEHISEYFDDLERLMQNGDELLGIPTGFREMDNLLHGLQKTDLIVIAARPGMGKTSMLVNIALHAARLGKRIGFITLEMGRKQIIQRMVSTETSINLQKLRSGKINPLDWQRFVEATNRISDFSIFIDDRTALTPMQVRQRTQRWMHQHGIDLVIVDYLQKMKGGKGYSKASDRVQEVSLIARSLKDLAKEFNIPVIAAAQLNRELEKRQDKRPVLSDLRESGEIEQEADIVMFLYRDEVYNEASEFPNQADVIVAKHRNGPTGTFSLYFEKSATKFMNASERIIHLNGVLEGPAE